MDDERIDAIQTRWSLIRNAHQPADAATASEARQQLVLRYVSAVRRYIGAIVADSELADELTQDFSLRLMKGDFAGAEINRGRFRDLLKTAVRNMVKNHWTKSNRRQTVDADLNLLSDSSESEQEVAWTSAWQRTVLDQTWARLKAEDGGKPSAGYQLLKLRSELPDASSEELAEALSRKLKQPVRPENARQMLRRVRARFAAHLLDEIRAGLDDESDERVQQELADLGLLSWFREER